MAPPGPDPDQDPSAPGRGLAAPQAPIDSAPQPADHETPRTQPSWFVSELEWRAVGCLVAPVVLSVIVLAAWILTTLGVPLTEGTFWGGVFIVLFGIPVVFAIVLVLRAWRNNRRPGSSKLHPRAGGAMILVFVAGVVFVGALKAGVVGVGYRTSYYIATPNAQTVDFLTVDAPNSSLSSSHYGFHGTFDESWVDPTFDGVNRAHATFSAYREGNDFTIEFNDEVVHAGQAGVILDPTVVAIFGAVGGQFNGAQILISVNPEAEGSEKNEVFAPSVATAYSDAVAKLGSATN